MKKTCNNSRNKFRRHINGGAQDIEELQQQLNNFKEKRDQLKLDAKEFEKSGNRKEAINRIKLMKQYEKLIEKQKKLIDTFKLTKILIKEDHTSKSVKPIDKREKQIKKDIFPQELGYGWYVAPGGKSFKRSHKKQYGGGLSDSDILKELEDIALSEEQQSYYDKVNQISSLLIREEEDPNQKILDEISFLELEEECNKFKKDNNANSDYNLCNELLNSDDDFTYTDKLEIWKDYLELANKVGGRRQARKSRKHKSRKHKSRKY